MARRQIAEAQMVWLTNIPVIRAHLAVAIAYAAAHTWPWAAATVSAESSLHVQVAERDVAGTHWSFRPITRPTPPDLGETSWVRNSIDQFVLQRLRHENVEPSPEANRRTLIRRLYLDLVGLPPSPEEVEQFLRDEREDAYEMLVERLLDSPHFGERWGRHWLDLARYADSDGYENDKPRPNAFRYRDWVVQAMNRDMPFDQFTREQLAGDLLEDPAVDQLTATGLHRNTMLHTGGDEDSDEIFRVLAVKDRLRTTSTAWLGLTLHCAECHDHKYDPISHEEYHQLLAIFNSADDRDVPVDDHGSPVECEPAQENADIEDDDDDDDEPKQFIRTFKAVARETRVFAGGDFYKRLDRVEPGTPSCLPPMNPRGENVDRLDLANWLIDPQHPLAARVFVNRIWQHLFGVGLVATPENFGLIGAEPSHPGLLDWLASETIHGGWSRKELIRMIVGSSTYRQSSVFRRDLVKKDPANRLWARQNRLRVEAEIVRDLALSVSGLLQTTLGGPRVQPPLPAGLQDFDELKHERFMESSGERYRRGIYINVQRTFVFPTLAAFDAPSGNETCPRRDCSNTPVQALMVLNDPVYFECTQALGRRLADRARTDASRSIAEHLQSAFELCTQRRPGDDELAVLVSQHAAQQAYFKQHRNEARQLVGVGEPHRADAYVADLAAWTDVAGTLINLDEFITRE